MITQDETGNKIRCGMRETRRHVFEECRHSKNKNIRIKEMVKKMTNREISTTAMIHMDIEHQSLKRRRELLLFMTRAMRRIYLYREENEKDFIEAIRESFGEKSEDTMTDMDDTIRAFLRDWG